MAKKFNIYLRERVHECDLFIYSLTYKDSVQVVNRLVLRSCIQALQMYKSAAARCDTELEAHIDNTLKYCRETLQITSEMEASIEFQTIYSLKPRPSIINISVDEVDLLTKAFTQIRSEMLLGVSEAFAFVKNPIGTMETQMNIDGSLDNISKTSLIACNCGTDIYGTVDFEKTSFIEQSSGMALAPQVRDLFYMATTSVAVATELSALVLGTEMHYPLGNAFSSVSLGFNAKLGLRQFEIVENIISMMATMNNIISFCIFPADQCAVSLGVSAEFVLKRHRLLTDMDNNGLSTYDGMSLEDADYVIL